jgi:Asp-tRNA(Asn)/Glu-tRNA(Gln) amidotransferase A subunit family amidase
MYYKTIGTSFAFLLWFVTSANAQDTLVQSDIDAAAKIAGVQLAPTEITMMYSDVKDNLGEYKKAHQLHLNNNIAMSMAQSPLLPGMAVPNKQLQLKWDLPNAIMPANKSDLAFYTITQLASLIKNKKISSVALTQFFIERLKKYGDTLQCVVSITEKIALEQAAQADADLKAGIYRSLLQGIPYGLKDLFAVKGTTTTWGAAPYKNQVINDDAFVYTKLKEAGAVLIAKFSLGSLAMGDYWYGGRTKNPWNLKTGSSGSSAGSAAATVAGLVPFAIGTETYGSIISPSHTCGATGLRPTFGTVSRSGAMALSWSLDKIGPICRNAKDAAIVYSLIHGTDGADASAVNAAFNYTDVVNYKKLKIAYVKNYFDKLDSNANEHKVLEVYRNLGATLTPITIVDSVLYPYDIIGIVIGAEAAAAFDELTRLNIDDQLTRQTKNDWPNFFRTARLIPAVEYVNANRARLVLMQQMDAIIKNYDAIIVPTFAGSQAAITNLTGHPAVCMPSGFSKSDMPTSFSIIGKLYGEATILALANAYQLNTNWEEVHPKNFKNQ